MVFMIISTPKFVIPKQTAAPVPWANLISVSGGCPELIWAQRNNVLTEHCPRERIGRSAAL